MINDENVGKYLAILVIIFVTYLLLGSFIVSCNYLDLGYLIMLYAFIISTKLVDK